MPGRIGFAPKLHSTRKSELRASCNLGVTKGAGNRCGAEGRKRKAC